MRVVAVDERLRMVDSAKVDPVLVVPEMFSLKLQSFAVYKYALQSTKQISV